MKSKFIVRLSLLVLVLFAVAVSTHAQQCPGFNTTMSQGAPSSASGMIPSSPCAGKSLNSTPSFYETNSLTDYCGSLDTGGYVSTTATVTGNGVAYCAGVEVDCEPYFYAYLTVATNQQDYNRFYYQAYDKTYTSSSGCVRAAAYSRQDFWQCGWYSCPPDPSGGGGGGGSCTCTTRACLNCPSPIIIDISGKGFVLTNAANGVKFDISGTGNPTWGTRSRPTAFTTSIYASRSSFLARPLASHSIYSS